MPTPIALSCGEPAGVGPELAQIAWDTLRADLPFVWLGDPRHLPLAIPHQVIASPDEAAMVSATAMPVFLVPFDGAATPGTADPANAAGVIRAIEVGVD
ncbi:MAG: 4-hydroxythreonine-4-phosphate dehydrogenase, partial [Pseudomonadota bacterium]